MTQNHRAVLFDLDGTLVDTAPDITAALAAMRVHLDLPDLPARHWRRLVSQGGRALVASALEDAPSIDQDSALAFFLSHYEAHVFEHSRIYSGMLALMDQLVDQGQRLGVVTNKRGALAERLLVTAELADRFDVVIGGDTTPHPKPRPEPVIAACEALGVAPSAAILIGDDRRDVEAARRAGAASVIAGWGYGAEGIDQAMRATSVWCDQPEDVWPVLQQWGQ